MSSDTYFWLFSTIAQILGIVISILGIFLVYVFQWIQSSIEWRRKDLVNIIGPYGHNVESLPLDGQLTKAREQIEKNNAEIPTQRSIDLLKAYEGIIPRRKKREELRGKFLTLAIATVSLISISLIGLVVAEYLGKHLVIGIVILALILITSFIIFAWMIKFVYDAISRKALRSGEQK